MQKKKRKAKEINAGSMADIAFLLLIFFLVTTTINAEKGIPVKLPPYEEDPSKEIVDVNKRNILNVKINFLDELSVEGEGMELKGLREFTKEFITNPNQRNDMPISPKKAIISLQNDRGTQYEIYLQVYNELKAAYKEIWDEEAHKLYNQAYETLTKAQKKSILINFPMIISEAEPTKNS